MPSSLATKIAAPTQTPSANAVAEYRVAGQLLARGLIRELDARVALVLGSLRMFDEVKMVPSTSDPGWRTYTSDATVTCGLDLPHVKWVRLGDSTATTVYQLEQLESTLNELQRKVVALRGQPQGELATQEAVARVFASMDQAEAAIEATRQQRQSEEADAYRYAE